MRADIPGVDMGGEDRADRTVPDERAGRAAGHEAVVIESLIKRYGEMVAVDGLSLTIPRGQVLGLLGPTARARRRRSAASFSCSPTTRARSASSVSR